MVIDKIHLEKGEKELVLCMDHNLDLLKCNIHEPTHKFLDILVKRNIANYYSPYKDYPN